jgi:hypothetical protein
MVRAGGVGGRVRLPALAPRAQSYPDAQALDRCSRQSFPPCGRRQILGFHRAQMPRRRLPRCRVKMRPRPELLAAPPQSARRRSRRRGGVTIEAMAALPAAAGGGSRPQAAEGGGAQAPALNRRPRRPTIQPSLRPLNSKTVAPSNQRPDEDRGCWSRHGAGCAHLDGLGLGLRRDPAGA